MSGIIRDIGDTLKSLPQIGVQFGQLGVSGISMLGSVITLPLIALVFIVIIGFSLIMDPSQLNTITGIYQLFMGNTVGLVAFFIWFLGDLIFNSAQFLFVLVLGTIATILFNIGAFIMDGLWFIIHVLLFLVFAVLTLGSTLVAIIFMVVASILNWLIHDLLITFLIGGIADDVVLQIVCDFVNALVTAPFPLNELGLAISRLLREIYLGTSSNKVFFVSGGRGLLDSQFAEALSSFFGIRFPTDWFGIPNAAVQTYSSVASALPQPDFSFLTISLIEYQRVPILETVLNILEGLNMKPTLLDAIKAIFNDPWAVD